MVKVKKIFQNITGRDIVLSFQHMFAMLGATILVPILAGLSIPVTLISAGLGTIIFYFVTQGMVPVFLVSSFAFLPALISLVVNDVAKYSTEWQDSVAAVSIALMLAGVVYIILSYVIKVVGVQKIRKLFPPIVVGPVIIVIGMILAPKMFYNNIIGQAVWTGTEPWKQWTTAIITAFTIIGFNAYSKPKSFFKVIPILMGFVAGYIYAAIIGLVSFDGVFSAQRIVLFQSLGDEFGYFAGYGRLTGTAILNAVLMIVPISIVTFMEHLGDISANSTVCGKDFILDPGIHRTVLGDGLATTLAGFLGAPANTTYGENTAVLAITKNYNPRNIFLAACLAIIFGIFTVFGDLLSTIPAAVIGGASIILFGMISASGLRALVDAKVDFNNSKNIIIVSVILAIGLGLGSMSLAGDVTGDPIYKIMIGDVEVSPLAIATLIGILLNIIIPNKKEEKAQYTYINFTEDDDKDKE